MKRLFILTTAVIMAIGLLGGCSSKGESKKKARIPKP